MSGGGSSSSDISLVHQQDWHELERAMVARKVQFQASIDKCKKDLAGAREKVAEADDETTEANLKLTAARKQVQELEAQLAAARGDVEHYELDVSSSVDKKRSATMEVVRLSTLLAAREAQERKRSEVEQARLACVKAFNELNSGGSDLMNDSGCVHDSDDDHDKRQRM